MPVSIQQLVSDSNIILAHERDLVNLDMCAFVAQLIEQSSLSLSSSLIVAPAALSFFNDVYLHIKKVSPPTFACSHPGHLYFLFELSHLT